jgi:CheY-like chemotaxis protein
MKTILIAEDDPPSAELLGEFLTFFGYRVTMAADAASLAAPVEGLLGLGTA